MTRILRSLTLLVMVGDAATVVGQSTWDASPYDIRVWFSIEPVPELAGAWQDQLPAWISQSANRAVGAAWRVRTEPAPEPLRFDVRHQLASVEIEALLEHEPQLLQWDKFFLVAISRLDWSGTDVRVRELDCRTQRWGPIVRRVIKQPARVGSDAARAVIEAFAPLAMIEKAEEDRALVRLRAGLLLGDKDSAATPPPGALLRPVLRQMDPYGAPIGSRVRSLPWTVLEVQTDQGGGVLECLVHSGLARPLAARPSRRMQQLAVAVRSLEGPTRLHLASRSDAARPLPAYDVYARDPGSDSVLFLGRSDWRGTLEIDPGPMPLRILHVRSGEDVLARLPLIPGEQPEVTALLPDHARRLEAEALATALQQQLLDAIARRRFLVRRVEQRISDKQLDEAEELIQELRQVPSREALLRELHARRQALVTQDRQVQRKIDRLLDQLEQRLSRHLDSREIDALQETLEAAMASTT